MRADNLDWDTLRIFRAVAELSSMNAASARLSESTPTISRKIDELERTLGVKLFERSTRGVELTLEGRSVLTYVEMIAANANQMIAQTVKHDPTIGGGVRIIAGDGLGPYWIAPKLGAFLDQNPNIRVKLSIDNTVPDLTEIDEPVIAVHLSPPTHHGVISNRLGTVHYIGFASPEYLKQHPAPESLFEYYKHRCILHPSYVWQTERWAPKVSSAGRMTDFALVIDSGVAMLEACAAGAGIAIMPSFIASIDSRIVPLDLPELAPLEFWMSYTERVKRMPHARQCINWLTRIFSEDENSIWFHDEFAHPREVRKASDAVQLVRP